MKRDILITLRQWRAEPDRKPIILRGARQVGKSWVVQSFGKEFPSFVSINFEKEISAKQLFVGDLDVKKIIQQITAIKKTTIVPGETLLFLDEIQECEQAITALRYFREEMPELHVIAAGSLIDFVLEKIGVPVGRVQFLYLHPLSFGEFLEAINHESLRQLLLTGKTSPFIHTQCLELIKTYFWLGGMPAVIAKWIEAQDVSKCQEIQDEILLSYKQDFYKYAKRHLIEKVDRVFTAIPEQLGDKFVFKHVDPELRAATLKEALVCLQKAGIAHICYHTAAQGQPLGASRDDKRFKVYFFDIGLAQRLLGLDLGKWIFMPIEVKHLGAIAEQFVAQEYIAYTALKKPPELYYWQREQKTSNAEVDFIFLHQNEIVPVEVKAGTKGSLKSLHLFLQSHPHTVYGLKISEQPHLEDPQLLSIPFYEIEYWCNFNH